ncbi:MAG: dihydroorotase [Sedimentisphaerales bacterium]|nr:dihydroorotase [Sedimentisphaerales bacterium]
MNTELLIKNGRVIDPANGIDSVCDVLVAQGKIAQVDKIEKHAAETSLRVIDAKDKLVVPGLIDIHVHFREPGDEEEETIASGSAAAVAAGFTSVVCMPNTNPVIENETDIEYIHRKARQARKTHVYTMGAITKGLAGVELAEMGFMAEAGAVGFTDDGNGVQDPAVMLRALKYAGMFNIVIAQHCQDDRIAGKGVMNAGYYSTILGLPGIDPLAEEAILWRDIQLIKKIPPGRIRYHAQHVSTAGSIELIRAAKKESLPITCEVTPHHLLLTEESCADYDTNYKVNPPLRSKKDVDALKQAIAEGLVDALATDHAPHLQSEKELEFLTAPFGIASLECALALYVKALIEPGILDWPGLIRLMTAKPAGIIGIDKGTLGIGKQADITIINPEKEYKIDTNSFLSKSRNCPYHGLEVKGKAEMTIVGGEVRFEA